MKVKTKVIDEVSEIGSRKGSRKGPRMTRIDPDIDLPRLVPRWPSDDLPDPKMTLQSNGRVKKGHI